MSINLAQLYTKLGKILGSARAVMGFVGIGPPSPASVWGSGQSGMSGANIRCLTDMLSSIQSQLGSNEPDLLGGTAFGVSTPLYSLATSMPQGVQQGISYFQQLAQGLIIKTVNDDVVLPSLQIQPAMTELIRQMIVQSSTVHANAVGSSVSAGGGNTGNPSIIISLKDNNGKNLEYAYDETMVLTTTFDASDGATEGNETINIAAPAGQVTPQLNTNWPSGKGFASGFNGTLTVVDPTQSDGSGGNLLSNSSFKTTWVSNQPPKWIADVGTAGTNWQDGTSNAYAGTSNCFQFIGDGSTLSSVYQSFANGSITGGNTTTLLPETVYLFRAKVKLSAASPSTGVLTFSLTDGSGTVLNDNAGNPCTITSTLSGIGVATYYDVAGSFQTPSLLPSSIRLRMKLTQALPSGKSVYIDYMALTQPTTQTYGGLYTGGPYMAAFRGSVDTLDYGTNPAVGDRWEASITNDYGGVWQTLLWQFMNMPSLGIPVPSSAAANTISDSLVS